MQPNVDGGYQPIPMLKRQDKHCDSSGMTEGYDEGLHIFAIFLIMTTGTLACSFPVVVKAFPRLAISKHALFISRHFGTGVLIALAFCHLLPTAFNSLWNECLSSFWTEGYSAMPGFIALMAALAVMLLEMTFTLKGVRHSHDFEAEAEALPSRGPRNAFPNILNAEDNSDCGPSQTSQEVCAKSDPCHAEFICPCDEEAVDEDHTGSPERKPTQRVVQYQFEALSHEQKEQRKLLQCILLEAGILFHSVFIGLSIALSTGVTFIALMVAISFHQIFEGLALRGRIADIESFKVSHFKPWLMSFAYGLTCPLGQAIGLGIRNSYNPDGQTALLVVGIANAISAGMIMYAGLVQLLGDDLLSERSYKALRMRSRMEAVIALILGCLLMAMIAIWA